MCFLMERILQAGGQRGGISWLNTCVLMIHWCYGLWLVCNSRDRYWGNLECWWAFLWIAAISSWVLMALSHCACRRWVGSPLHSAQQEARRGRTECMDVHSAGFALTAARWRWCSQKHLRLPRSLETPLSCCVASQMTVLSCKYSATKSLT